ncbi:MULTISPECIES: hypothetical protein [unclassified Pseudomonas]|uniref:hypothetical protein n=1 Tax=unclassified Pseudomonas TaxID=196821 RepID=UPI00244835CB|nr:MULTISPECIES: hypothetical protein [unclassified Pseudomonas]MDG9922881.1 hypothetical protein [Pseudomonas sp. GD04045]MDH0035755.1 hypothetical protein [Pseudomonas sp. GD04019]
MKYIAQLFKGKVSTFFATSLSLVFSLFAVNAHAAWTAPTAATAFYTDATSAWTWIEGNMWTLGGAILLGFFVWRLAKKAANKSA